MPATSPTKTSSGSAITSATSRGMTSTWIGDSPRVLIASISSSTFIVPICAVKAAPGAAGDEDRAQDRRQLAADAQGDAVGDEQGGAVALRLHAEHVGDDHADQEVHQGDDGNGVDAHGLELRHRLARSGKRAACAQGAASSSVTTPTKSMCVFERASPSVEHGRADALHEPQVHRVCPAAGGVVMRS